MFDMTQFPTTRMAWSERIRPMQENNRNVKKEDFEGIQILSHHLV